MFVVVVAAAAAAAAAAVVGVRWAMLTNTGTLSLAAAMVRATRAARVSVPAWLYNPSHQLAHEGKKSAADNS